MKKIYLNLTTGIEKIEEYPTARITRIQSSHIESKAYNYLLYGLSDDLLFSLATGHECIIIDGSSNRSSKVIRIFIPVFSYIINRLWFRRFIYPHKMNKEFLEKIYKSLSRKTKKKIRYFSKFINTNSIDLKGVSFKTFHDGDYGFYSKLFRKEEQ